MDTTAALLDRAKDVLAITSDYELARRLGVTHSTISNYRAGRATPEPAIAGLIAEIIGQPPFTVIAIIEHEREANRTNPRLKVLDFWRRHSPRLLPTVIIALAVGQVSLERHIPGRDLTERGLPAIHYAYWLLSLLRRWTRRVQPPLAADAA